MPYFTYDTSVIIARKVLNLKRMPQNFLLSAVVLMELIASTKDLSQRRAYEQLYRQYQRDNLLIAPTEEDWLLAAQILFLLTHARRRLHKGKLKQLPPGASQRLALDVLLAVSARRWKAQVVTENWSDFKAIQRYCNTTIVKAAQFFHRFNHG
jgi:predicted nucleic acid-binding protein